MKKLLTLALLAFVALGAQAEENTLTCACDALAKATIIAAHAAA